MHEHFECMPAHRVADRKSFDERSCVHKAQDVLLHGLAVQLTYAFIVVTRHTGQLQKQGKKSRSVGT